MADIPVERRPELPLWAGILGLLALIATIWILFSLGANARTHANTESADHAAVTLPGDIPIIGSPAA